MNIYNEIELSGPNNISFFKDSNIIRQQNKIQGHNANKKFDQIIFDKY